MKKVNFTKLLTGLISIIALWEAANEDDELTDTELKRIVKALANLLGVDVPGIDIDESTGVITISPKKV